MKYYGDLRDYHNKKFIENNLETFLASIINIIGLSSTIKYANGDLSYNLLSQKLAFIFAFLEIDTLYSGLTDINKDLKKLDLRSIENERKNLYEQILNNICIYIKNTNITNPKDIMHLLNKILNKGYLSYKKKFKYDNITSKSFEFSYQIINGSGVCRHIAQLTTDIFKKLGYEAYDLFCTDNKDNKPRHMITMVNYNNKIYYLDTTNNIVYNYYEGILKNSKINYMPINIYSKNFNQIDEKDIDFITIYYTRKRNFEECMKCMFTPLKESYGAYDGEIENKNKPRIIYEKNKKLYKKFNKTYL